LLTTPSLAQAEGPGVFLLQYNIISLDLILIDTRAIPYPYPLKPVPVNMRAGVRNVYPKVTDEWGGSRATILDVQVWGTATQE
jgi:hypothetical protein